MTPSTAQAGARRPKGAGHELRDVVLAAATDLLAERGSVDALTMRDVATASGVTAPSVYRHFPDKQALVRAVVSARFAAFDQALDAAADQVPTTEPVRRLEARARAYVGEGLRHPGHYRVLFSATAAGPTGLGLSDGQEHPGAASYRALVASVAACLPVPGTPVHAGPLAAELWASLHGIVDLRITKPELPWPDTEHLVDRALTGIRMAAAG